jgi:hypothetical protein
VSRNDSVFAVAENANGQPSYLLFRNDLSVLYSYTGNVTHTHPTGIAVNGGTIHLIAEATSQPASHVFTSYFSSGLTGQLGAKQDIGVTGFTVVQAGHQLSGYTPIGLINLDATIRNFGTDTVHSFMLNHYRMISGNSYCLIGLNKLYSVLVPPGDSVVVRTGTFFTAQFNNYSPSSPYQYPLCLYTSIPNQQSDNKADNDASCAIVTLLPTTLREDQQQDGIRVYPNPSTGAFVIRGDARLQVIDVYSSWGQLVLSEAFENNEELFEISQPPGLYFVRVKSGSLSRTVKVIVE